MYTDVIKYIKSCMIYYKFSTNVHTKKSLNFLKNDFRFTYLSFECVVLLGEVFFSEVVLVSTFVSPFIYLVFGYIDILEIMVRSITATLWSRNWDLWKGGGQSKCKC